MIQKLLIKNFQIHKRSELEFSPGINVITGSSDEGKSTIIRAIKWLVSNTPRGKSFLRNNMGKKDECSVTMEINNHSVTRRTTKSNSVNQYVLDGEEYNAVRSEVPQPVQEAVNITNTNVQPQHEFTFLLSDTPGEVAKKLNDVIGVDIIDNALKYVDSLKRKTNSKLNYVKEEIVNIQQKIDEYENVDDIDKILTECEKYQYNLETITDEIPVVDGYIKKMRHIKSEITNQQKLADLVTEVDDGLVKISDLKSLDSTISSIDSTVKKIPKIQQNIDGINEQMMAKIIEESSVKVNQLRALEKEQTSISTTLGQFDSIQKEIRVAEKNKEETDGQLEELKQEMKICPLCETNLS